MSDPRLWTRIHLARGIKAVELFFKLKIGVMNDLLNAANIDRFLVILTPYEARVSSLKLHIDTSASRIQIEEAPSNLFQLPL